MFTSRKKKMQIIVKREYLVKERYTSFIRNNGLINTIIYSESKDEKVYKMFNDYFEMIYNELNRFDDMNKNIINDLYIIREQNAKLYMKLTKDFYELSELVEMVNLKEA